MFKNWEKNIYKKKTKPKIYKVSKKVWINNKYIKTM